MIRQQTIKAKFMPTLSGKGWVSSLPEKLDFALCHFFESEETASYLYPDMIADVHTIIARHSSDIDGTIEALTTTLNIYLQSIFDEAEVHGLNLSAEEGDKSSRVTVKLSVRVKDNYQVLEKNKVVNYAFRKFRGLADLLNG